MTRFRVAFAGLIHETNTFAPSPTTLADFDMHGSSPPILRGAEILQSFGSGGSSAAGILDALHAGGAEIVPLTWSAAQPGGIVTRAAFDTLLGEILSGLDRAGPLDAVVLDLHGAMAAEGCEDAEGAILAAIRERVGPDVFLAAALDCHGNTSARMVEVSDLLIAYRTYPHVDMAETGSRVAQETISYLKRGTRPAKAFAQLPYLIPIHAQCTLTQPMLGLIGEVERADQMYAAAVSLLPGFPPADIHDCGPSILAYAPDQGKADAALGQVLAAALEAEPAFAAVSLRDGPDAVTYSLERTRATGAPVIVADTQDNPGAGASSDTMGLVEELLAQRATDAVVAVIHDPDAASQAHSAGMGAILEISLGGRGGPPEAGPLRDAFRVEALGQGVFKGTGAYYNDAEVNFGPMALLKVGDSGVRVIVGSRRAQAGTQAIFRHLGLDPRRIAVLGLKSSVHFLADFSELTPDIVFAGFPGLNTADPEQMPYRHIRPSVRRRPRTP